VNTAIDVRKEGELTGGRTWLYAAAAQF